MSIDPKYARVRDDIHSQMQNVSNYTLSLRLWIWNNTPLWVSNMSCHFKEFDKLFRAHSCTASYLYFMCSNWMTEFSHNTIWHCTENEVNWFTASISLSPTSCTETSRRPRFLMGHTGLEGALGEFHCEYLTDPFKF